MKTEDDIAREKEAVQKMIGAKSAMEAALSRIERLQSAIGSVQMILSDLHKNLGDGLYVKTFHHGSSGNGEATIKAKDQLAYAKRIMDAVK